MKILARHTIEDVEEAIAVREEQELARSAAEVRIDQDGDLRGVDIVHVVRRELKMPRQRARSQPPRTPARRARHRPEARAPHWRSALLIVQPDTVVRWYRQWLRRRWMQRSRQKRPDRPRTDVAIRILVAKMLSANPLWGAPRIHGELQRLGVDISERTVSRLVSRRQRPPSQTWRTFLANHLSAIVSTDFFTVPTLTGRILFVLVVLAHQRRRVGHLSVTEHPTAEWTAQQIITAFPEDTAQDGS